MKLFDTHCHYNLQPLKETWQEHWRLAQKNTITHSIVVGTDYQSSKIAQAIAKDEPNLFASVGFHPGFFLEHIDRFVTDQVVHSKNGEAQLEQILKQLESLIADTPIAIGEVGLDFYRLRSKGLKREVIVELQKKALTMQLTLAKKHDLPVIFHVRDQEDRTHNTAYQEVIQIIEKNTPKKFVLHCASGSLDYIKKALDLGAFIGFDGNITYQSADHLRDIFKCTPIDRILLETDAPYLAPGLHKNEVCEPWMITETAHFLHDYLGANLEQIYQNSFLFFDIPINRIQ